MKITLVTIEFKIIGCTSLKEKRSRMSPIKRIFGKISNMAICESGYQDDHNRSEWSFVICSNNSAIIDSTINKLENELEINIDAQIISMSRENYL